MSKLWLIEGLRSKPCTLAIPRGAACGAQMTTSQIKQTSPVAICRIYVEQVIKKLKNFRYSKEKNGFFTYQ